MANLTFISDCLQHTHTYTHSMSSLHNYAMNLSDIDQLVFSECCSKYCLRSQDDCGNFCFVKSKDIILKCRETVEFLSAKEAHRWFMETLAKCHSETSQNGRNIFKYSIGGKPGDFLRAENVCQTAFAHSYGISVAKLTVYQEHHKNDKLENNVPYSDRSNLEDELQNTDDITEIFSKYDGIPSCKSAVSKLLFTRYAHQ